MRFDAFASGVVLAAHAPGVDGRARLLDGAHVVDRLASGVDEVRIFDFPIEFGPWLERSECRGEDADRVRALLEDRITGDQIVLERIALRASPS